MRRKKASSEVEEPDADLLRHINGLGLHSVEAYRQWCSDNGFSKSLSKHWKQRCRERFHVQAVVAKERLTRKKREKRGLPDILAGICEGRLTEQDVTQPYLKRLCEAVSSRQVVHGEPLVHRKSLAKLLAHLSNRRAKLFDDLPVVAAMGQMPGNTYVEALTLAARHAALWLRPIEQWEPRSHSARKQFTSLIRHLFVQHDDMPLFFDAVWFAGCTKGASERRRWYRHVGRGQSIRYCELPILYTKKMAHFFMKAPANVTVDQALRWGQVLGLGGEQQLAEAVLGTRLVENLQHDEFWASALRWFIGNPMLDREHVGPIIDYLHHQRFVPEIAVGGLGQGREAVPPQPNLSMNGRVAEALLRRVNEWHRKLADDNTQQLRQWQPSGINGFEWVEGSLEGQNFKRWTIRELLSSRALIAEGRQMKHCVASYAASCARAYSSIWSVQVESYEGTAKALTVEVRNSTRSISQARGKANRLPTEKERNILSRWAAASGLTVASYI